MTENTRVMISEKRAIRGLANPIRLLAVDEIYRAGRGVTATELSQLTGVTASAMSYHLRALESYGLIRRENITGDGRERPWAAVADDYSIVASDDDDAVARAVIIDGRLSPMRQRMEQVLAQRSLTPESQRRETFMVLATGTLVLTTEELHSLQRDVTEVFERYEHLGAGRSLESDSYRRGQYLWSTLPDEVSEGD